MKPSAADLAMLAEIQNQPAAWRQTIDLLRPKADRLASLTRGMDEVVFTGCGSGLNASEAIAPTFQSITGIRARAVPAAEIVFFPDTVLSRSGKTLVVPISRSGSTTETEMARQEVERRGMQTLAITCYPDSPLARHSTEAVVLEAANEKSVTTTQSLTSMVLCGQLVAGLVAGNTEYLGGLERLPDLGRRLLEPCHEMGRKVAESAGLRKFAFVGSGPLRGLAREAQLKFKEMVLLPSDSYPLLDYRHGPKSNVDAQMLVTVFSTDRTRRVEAEFMAEMKGLQGRLLLICENADGDHTPDFTVEMASGLPDLSRDILSLLPIHFLAYYKSLAEGQSPSTPKNLTYWVPTEKLT